MEQEIPSRPTQNLDSLSRRSFLNKWTSSTELIETNTPLPPTQLMGSICLFLLVLRMDRIV